MMLKNRRDSATSFGDGDSRGYGLADGDGEGDGYGYGSRHGNGCGFNYGNNYDIGKATENPHCTRLIDGDNIAFIHCQQYLMEKSHVCKRSTLSASHC